MGHRSRTGEGGHPSSRPALQGKMWLSWLVFQHLFLACFANQDAKRLYSNLLANYDRLIRPVANSSDRLTVHMRLKLSQVIGVDMRRQILTTNVWVEQEWADYKLSWNPADYGGVKHLHVPSQDIWLPDIVLYNNADGNYEVTIMTKAILNWNGKVNWNPPAIYKSYCGIDVEFFPFDEQECWMKFGSWTYDGFMLDLRHMNQLPTNDSIGIAMDLRDFYISTEWDVMEVPAQRNEKYYPCCEEPYPDIVFSLKLRRKTLFYTVNLIIPCVGISFLSVLVFYLPSDSGEKVSLSISILLSLTVFFLLLAEIIPPTSLSVPLLGKYLLFTMILVTFSVVVTIGVLNVNFRTPATHKMAPWVRKIFIDFLPRYLFIQRPEPDEEESVDQEVITAGYNIVFPETLEERNSVSRLLNHAQYDGGGFRNQQLADIVRNARRCRRLTLSVKSEQRLKFSLRLGAPGDQQKSLQLQPQLSLQLDSDRFSFPEKQLNGGALRYDSGFRDSVQEQEPHLEKAINSVRFVAQHVKNQDRYNKVADDWKYVAMVLDRILLWIFSFACVAGTCGIILVAPSLYDTRKPIDIIVSKISKRKLLPAPPQLDLVEQTFSY